MSNPVQNGPFVIDDEGVGILINGKRIPVMPTVMLGADGNVVDPSTAQYQLKDDAGHVLGTSTHPVQYSNTNGQQYAKVSVTGVTGHAAAALFSLAFAADTLVTKVIANVRTIATGAVTIDVGSTAVTAGTASDNLLDGIDIHSATGLLGLADQAGANGKAQQFVAAGKWVTAGADATANVDGFVGDFYIFYVNA